MKMLLTATVCFLVSSSAAFAECTRDEMLKKMTQLDEARKSLPFDQPNKINPILAKMTAITEGIDAKLATCKGEADALGCKVYSDEVCKAYDELIAVMK